MTDTSMIERVARAIMSDLADRSGVLDGIDDDVLAEMRGSLARAAIEPVIDHAIAIMEARLPLYTDIAARNAIRECISSIKASALVKALEE